MDGIMVVDKPAAWTSHDVVNFVRKNFQVNKVGHAGSLDPQATGVLVILLGRATKESLKFSSQDKEYEATLGLGRTTDTQDSSGKTLIEKDCSEITGESVKKVFESFLGETQQVPPMVSALKSKGIRLYSLAHQGLEVERNPRKIEIKKLDILNIDLPHVRFDVLCSKGTYIRTLCHDIGEALGCGGHLASLRRVRSGKFVIKDAVTIEELKEAKETSGLKGFVRDEF
ncbi:MAG: tRNA pseudouridine(55) synthase TruB [Candidatus Saganbacteria bacterium]|nr:tRNA pseudouridine(55) synthase TruB [Candidatus Saganbacteria bacterium]